MDIITGDGLADALSGVETVVDVATGPSPEEQAATEFFTTAARNLHEAGQTAGVQRIIVLSIIGIDKFTAGYNAAKVAHEHAMLSGPIPVRILRAAQFHEFVAQLMEWGTQGDVSYVPKMRTQLVAARTVAQALADLAAGAEPAGVNGVNGVNGINGVNGARFSEIAGPREESLVDMARLVAAGRGGGVSVEGVSDQLTPTATSTSPAPCCRGPRPRSPVRRSRSGSSRRPEPSNDTLCSRTTPCAPRRADHPQRWLG